ncbi:MFS transporter [Paenibacillus spongiae]|uniref:MFS transporter n=1 Tax=Paenibacillus spongiae TaxID=2909671 RepID=A0ABY5S4W9_9BACL|nr:MFS transporter [Paenibacillus spongiae]UVI28946.1 MFS transporter [Paenibacillus spongiae]
MNIPTIKHPDKLLRVLVFALIFSVMNGTMFNVALPVIGKEFSLMPSQVSWIMTSYMVIYAVGSVVYGKLADRYRLKDLLTIGLLVFAVGSIVGMLASDYWMIILGRVLQAAGAAVLPATAMIIPVRYFPPEKRGRALGTSAVGLALGGALGPVVAGLIASFGSWRLLFLFSLLSLVTLPFFRKYLDNDRGTAGHLDLIGGLLLAGTVAFVLLAITQSNWLLFAAGLVVLVLFIARIRSVSNPFVQPGIFRNRSYSVGLLIAFITTAMNFGVTFMTPQYLAALNGLSPGSIGLVLFPAAIASAIMGRRGGKLADDKGNSFLLFTASFLMLLCFALISTLIGASPYIIAVILIAGNVGQTFMQITMSNTLSRTLSKDQVGVGMGLFSMVNFISGAISMSFIGKLLDNELTTIRLNPLVTNEAAYIYSNIFLVMCVLTIAIAGLYRLQFGAVLSKAAEPKADKG